MKLASLLACAAVALSLVLLLGGSSSLVSATEFRLIKSANSSNGYVHGRLLYQPSSASGTSWFSVKHSGFNATDAKAMCRWLGFSAAVTSVSWSVGYDLSYLTSYAISCAAGATTISSSASMSAFGTFCTTQASGVYANAVSLSCAEPAGTEYTGGGIGAYMGPTGPGSSVYTYVRTYENRFQWRDSHSTIWYSLCSSPSMPDATTQRAMCAWLNHNNPSAFAVGTSTRVGDDGSSFMSSLKCTSSSGVIESCDATVLSSCSAPAASSAVLLTCISSTVGAPTTTSSPGGNSTASTEIDAGVIIGASVGGGVGLIIIVAIVAAVCWAKAAGPATAAADGHAPVANTQPTHNKEQPPHPTYDGAMPPTVATGAPPPPQGV
jgi:hypothetical protein